MQGLCPGSDTSLLLLLVYEPTEHASYSTGLRICEVLQDVLDTVPAFDPQKSVTEGELLKVALWRPHMPHDCSLL